MKKEKLFAICFAATLLLAGCGGGGASNGGSEGVYGNKSEATADVQGGDDMFFLNTAPSMPESTESGGGGEDSSVYRDAEAKLIRRAELDIQTEQFDDSVKALNQMVANCGGYYEVASVYGGGRRDAYANRQGEYTVRIPAEKYSQFFNNAGELGYITSSTESSEDIGEDYYDTEARLKTQRTKQERLLALLEKAETMEDIIALESALSEVEYQIEQYSSTLNRYDALVGFSTFQIHLSEVGKVTQAVGETSSLGQRMAAGFQSSFRGIVQGAQEFLVWVSYNLVWVVILAAVGVTAVVVGLRELKKLQKKSDGHEET